MVGRCHLCRDFCLQVIEKSTQNYELSPSFIFTVFHSAFPSPVPSSLTWFPKPILYHSHRCEGEGERGDLQWKVRLWQAGAGWFSALPA